ncbi:hypothetical protein BH23GEM9_BH23GEM9_35520 [soil metagenome]
MRRSALLVFAVAAAACRGSPSEPEPPRVSLAAFGDDVVYAAVGQGLPEPLYVAAVDPASRSPVRGVQITWRLLEGAAELSPTASTTDVHGLASTSVRAAAAGVYRISASAPRLVGPAAAFELRVVPRPIIDAVSPTLISAGGEVTITGANFSATPGDNAVFFDGVRGQVISATPTQLRVTVPACLPSREVSVSVGLGAVMSAPRFIVTTGANLTTLSLQPGDVRTFSDAADLACLRLPGQNGAMYLFGIHSTRSVFAPGTSFELRALTPQPVATVPVTAVSAGPPSWASDWEMRLRVSERSLGPIESRDSWPQLRQTVLPSVGDRREFSVIDRDNNFHKMEAIARRVGTRGIIYVDVEAETAFTDADIASLGEVFDDPIYSTNVSVFGEPSDLDGNQRIIILFTPRVNLLTPPSQSSFIAGYFYGCDLVARNRCSGSNLGEIFYSMVPDPTGRWGDARSRTTVMAAVPPVMAHELQHMIHFARRGFSADALWLSEALAHTAEELVADVFAARGDGARSSQFRAGNLLRAQQYLVAPSSTSMISEESPGSVQMRGVGWLFLKYIRGHYGGNDLLRRLTVSSRSSTANVTQETARDWVTLVSDFGVALYASGADISGPVAPRHGFTGFNLRSALAPLAGGYPLRPGALGWGNFAVTASVAAASHDYYTFAAPAAGSAPQLSIVLSGVRGAPLSTESGITLTVLRIR